MVTSLSFAIDFDFSAGGGGGGGGGGGAACILTSKKGVFGAHLAAEGREKGGPGCRKIFGRKG